MCSTCCCTGNVVMGRVVAEKGLVTPEERPPMLRAPGSTGGRSFRCSIAFTACNIFNFRVHTKPLNPGMHTHPLKQL